MIDPNSRQVSVRLAICLQMARVGFLAVVPDCAPFDAGSFLAVCSSNPEDAAQFAIQQLSTHRAISLVSFGPTTVTSHAYFVGDRPESSVIDSLLRLFLEADREIHFVIENSQTRFPKGQKSFCAVRSESDLDLVHHRISEFPALDFIKVTLVIAPYTIVLLSLPPFVPFKNSNKARFEANGWKILLTPSRILSTKSFVFLHFDLSLPN
jgi:hypothetical protein